MTAPVTTLRASSPDRPLRPGGRRHTILKALHRDILTMSQVCRAVSAQPPLRGRDPSVERLKTTAALRDLRRSGYVARAAEGWTITVAGLCILNEARP